MSKQRARARAEREQLAAEQAAARADLAAREAAVRARRERRSLVWRRLRLWRHGAQFRRHREALGVLVALLALGVFAVYLLTRSLADCVGTALILLIVAPVLWALAHDRSSR